MNIFLTGATGYLGRPLVHRLVEAGHLVTALVRDARGGAAALADGARVVQGDVRDVDSVMPDRTEGVVHLAFSLFPGSCRATNVAGSLEVMQAALKRRVRRFVYTSSSLPCIRYGARVNAGRPETDRR